jgi:hypothetical protein
LLDKLRQPRVQRVIAPIIAGGKIDADPTFDDDVSYVRDLGLIAIDEPIRVANPIYREVIVRALGSAVESVVADRPQRFLTPDGRIDFAELLRGFMDFWVENGEVLTKRADYHEVAAQLVSMAYINRIVNGGGDVDREYGVGRGRIDLLVRKPYTSDDGRREVQREALELKVWRPTRKDPLPIGLKQLDEYLDRLGLDTGTLVIFDRRPEAAPIDERTAVTSITSSAGRAIALLRA